jgi:hypothetical protein
MPHRQHLRSAQHGDLAVARTRTSRLGTRSFTQSAATVWNALPPALRNSNISNELFKNNLKTYLFRIAYNMD